MLFFRPSENERNSTRNISSFQKKASKFFLFPIFYSCATQNFTKTKVKKSKAKLTRNIPAKEKKITNKNTQQKTTEQQQQHSKPLLLTEEAKKNKSEQATVK